MAFTMCRQETGCIIDCTGDCGVNSVTDLKALLGEGLSLTDELRVNMQQAEGIDITVLQLLWAAAREAAQAGKRFRCVPSDQGRTAARDAGFDCFPGEMAQV